MDLELAKTLVQVLENDGYDVSLREEYSGRSMYGKTTAAVVIRGDTGDVVSAVINNASYFVDRDGIEKFEINGFVTDSMGLGIVIY